MKAKEYVERMLEKERTGGNKKNCVSYLVVWLIKECAEIMQKRKCVKVKALASVIKEFEKKYQAIQKLAPQFWDSSSEFKNISFVNLVEIVAPDLGKVYKEALDYKEG